MTQPEELVHVCISVHKDAEGPFHSPSDCCIFRVHDHLRNVSEKGKAYIPNIIAIGPYHSGKGNHLQLMEKHKRRYLELLLQRKNDHKEKYIDALRSLEGEVRRCYAEHLEQDANQLVYMMLLDGCFIVELVRKFTYRSLIEKNDPIFQMEWIINSLQRDLLLFENQIPFFVLCMLFDMTKDPNVEETFTFLAKRFFKDVLPGEGREDNDNRDLPHKFKHLLGLVHNNWLPLFSMTKPIKSAANRKEKPVGYLTKKLENFKFICCAMELKVAGITFRQGKGNTVGYLTKKLENFKFIRCAMELKDAGIKFKQGKGNLFDITFKNGIMRIPPLIIEDRTESLLRNLIAHEQYRQGTHFHFVSDYVKFMNCLIDSPRDVGSLRRRGIINNWLGDDEVVANMFNKMTESVVGSGEYFHYNQVFIEVNNYCNTHRHRWMGTLRRKYLNTPWAIISMLAAFVLLVLTLLQTVFTIKH
ncbi:hypothetical protein LguiA_002007 [Lonicera macranthoides]